MKALTVRQPWAWAIASGAKTVENRTRGTSYRGPLAIHAATRWSDRGADNHHIHLEHGRRMFQTDLYVVPMPHAELFPTGAVIAVVQLVDSHPDTGCCRPWGESTYEEAGGLTRTVLHHLVLEHAQQLTTPLPARGALGLWTPQPDLLHAPRRRRMTVTTSCYWCLTTITVPLAHFDQRATATCRDTGHPCPRPQVIR